MAPMSARSPDFEEAIHANRADVVAYQMYSDWLQTIGDPRGELIAIQVAMGEGDAWLTAGGKLWRAVDDLFQAHAEAFFGPAHGSHDAMPVLKPKPRDGHFDNWPTRSYSYGFFANCVALRVYREALLRR